MEASPAIQLDTHLARQIKSLAKTKPMNSAKSFCDGGADKGTEKTLD